VDGKLIAFESTILTATDTKRLCYGLLTDAQRHKFEEDNELDFSFVDQGLSRFQSNLYVQRARSRSLPAIPLYSELFLSWDPPVCMN
jgi:Tfp pilus assembly pilus retraction ATPase PilT